MFHDFCMTCTCGYEVNIFIFESMVNLIIPLCNGVQPINPAVLQLDEVAKDLTVAKSPVVAALHNLDTGNKFGIKNIQKIRKIT